MQRGIDTIWPFVGELFAPEESVQDLDGIGVHAERLRESFEVDARRHILAAGLEVPAAPFARGGGRDGIHTEVFGHLLAEMQVLARAHPGATW
jgi:ring-1,2-phenylacetyl-CoA epoxidase subunit PaaC